MLLLVNYDQRKLPEMDHTPCYDHSLPPHAADSSHLRRSRSRQARL